MKALSMSGGGTKIAAILGAVDALDESYDIVAGISAGAILTPVVAMGLQAEAKQMIFELELKDFFSQSPVTKRGKMSLRAYWNIIWGLPYLGKMDALVRSMESIISEQTWNQSASPLMWVQDVDIKTGHRNFTCLNNMPRFNAFKIIQDSASIPVFARGGSSNTRFDGGVMDHIPSEKVIQVYGRHLTELVSIYSRPKHMQISLDQSWKPRNVFSILSRYIEIANFRISQFNAFYEQQMAREMGFRLRQYFLPVDSDGYYDLDDLPGMYRQAFKIVKGIKHENQSAHHATY